ncbi:MAG: hypothetical protein HKL89_10960 [Candidatus Dormibacteraeota bacterium]|nr:hypothetical protein [Candidatus Dormibacteraeota bacterium]
MATAKRQLVCPYGCRPARFELLGGAVFVDSSGSYLDHQDKLAAFRCASCGAVALDLASAAAAMARESRYAPDISITCPACGAVLLPPGDYEVGAEMECPECASVFSMEEGSPHLLGDFSADEDESEQP